MHIRHSMSMVIECSHCWRLPRILWNIFKKCAISMKYRTEWYCSFMKQAECTLNALPSLSHIIYLCTSSMFWCIRNSETPNSVCGNSCNKTTPDYRMQKKLKFSTFLILLVARCDGGYEYYWIKIINIYSMNIINMPFEKIFLVSFLSNIVDFEQLSSRSAVFQPIS